MCFLCRMCFCWQTAVVVTLLGVVSTGAGHIALGEEAGERRRLVRVV